MKGVWMDKTDESENGEVYICGKWTVGAIDWNEFQQPNEPGRKWIAICWLPGIPERIGIYQTIDEAKTAVEHDVSHWFNKLEHTK